MTLWWSHELTYGLMEFTLMHEHTYQNGLGQVYFLFVQGYNVRFVYSIIF
jgi:hypothetical protein